MRQRLRAVFAEPIRSLIAAAIALLGVAAPSAVRAAPPRVDPGVVGLWELEQQKTPFTKDVRTVFELRPDGTYTLHDVARGHAGTYGAAGGRWSLRSRTTSWQDEGTYAVRDGRALDLTGRFGPSQWHRLAEPSVFATAAIGGQPIPIYLPLVVAQNWVTVAKPWRGDAIPIGVDVRRWPSNGEFQVAIRFLSPAARSGLVVTLFKFQRSTVEQKRVDWPARAIPLSFVDLPRVIELATGAGRPGPYKRFWFGDQDPGVGWGVDAERATPGNLFMITADGRIDRNPHSSYKDYYNAQWERAHAAMRRAFGGGGGDYAGDAFWRDMCQRRWSGSGGGTYIPSTGACY
jgi:hypothetical protein